MRFQNSCNRDWILVEARKREEMHYDNTNIMPFPDFSVETQRKHHFFLEFRMRLRGKGLKYSIVYPSKLRVEYQGTLQFFESLGAVTDCLGSIESISILLLCFPSVCFLCQFVGLDVLLHKASLYPEFHTNVSYALPCFLQLSCCSKFLASLG